MDQLYREILSSAGFSEVGHWQEQAGKLKLSCEWSQQSHLVYAFVIGDHAQYLGVTTRTFGERMRGYSAAHKTQPSNVKIRDLMLKSLTAGQEIDIFAVVPDPISCQGWNIEPAVSLENWMIRNFDLPWNTKGKISF